MSDLHGKLEQIKSKENFLEKIKRWIPGYDGYVNRDNSRELDTLLRNKLATMLEDNKTKIKNTVSNLSKNKKLFESQDIDKLDKKNETVIAKLKSAARGYSGAFDVVKIKEEKLTQLYEYDAAMITDVQNLDAQFTEMESNSAANTDIAGNVSKISDTLDDFLRKFDAREMMLREFN